MNGFSSVVEYRAVGNGLSIITKAFRFYYSETKEGEYVEVLPLTLTNFATIPGVLKFIWHPAADDVRAPSALHDAMVGEFSVIAPIKINGLIVRTPDWFESAKWFKAALKARGCPFIKRNIFYCAVVLRGKFKQLKI